MAIGVAILLGVGLYLAAALPIAVVIGRMLGGPPAEVALAGAAVRPTRAMLTDGLVGTHVAAGRAVTLVARHPHAGRELELAGAEAHPAHA